MFCKYCGTEVPDGYVCNCPQAVAERNAAAAPAAAPVATAAKPASPISDAFKALPTSAKTLLNNPEGPGTNIYTAAIYAVGSLLLNILSWVLIVAGLLGQIKDEAGDAWEYVEKYFDGVYTSALLGGLLTCIVPIALTLCVIVIGQKIRKEQVDATSAFITASCINVVPSAIFLVGALFSMFLGGLAVLIILAGIICYLAANYKLITKFVPNADGVIGILTTVGILTLMFALIAWVVYMVIQGYSSEEPQGGSAMVSMIFTGLLEGLMDAN